MEVFLYIYLLIIVPVFFIGLTAGLLVAFIKLIRLVRVQDANVRSLLLGWIAAVTIFSLLPIVVKTKWFADFGLIGAILPALVSLGLANIFYILGVILMLKIITRSLKALAPKVYEFFNRSALARLGFWILIIFISCVVSGIIPATVSQYGSDTIKHFLDQFYID